jgi:signal transduction histidine kinase
MKSVTSGYTWSSVVVALILLGTGVFATAAAAGGFATREEAVAMVGKTLAALKEDRGGTLKAITAKDPRFIDRDLYVTIYDMDGLMLAHGALPGMVGKNMIELRDIDGVPYVRERLTMARSKEAFWHDYKFTDPVTKKVMPKSMYCQRLPDMVVCAGVYKR